MDLAKDLSTTQRYDWTATTWEWNKGYGTEEAPKHHVVAIDYGVKANILRLLADQGCRVTVVPAATPAAIPGNMPAGTICRIR
jgi:carbamoyl-phosphate synthase small subunit